MLCLRVCIGSSCHLKGSAEVVAALRRLITENKLDDRVELTGSVCLKNCTEAVSVLVNDSEIVSLSLNEVEQFFHEKVALFAAVSG
ncbi:MAG: (2Fe-2S) ferredoxin domain-containing protein [Christensenellales bacterium]